MKLVFTRQIYFSDEDTIKVIEEGMKIAKRERWSFNRLIGESLKEFVERHKEGNVSFQLDKFGVTWTKALSVKGREKRKCDANCEFWHARPKAQPPYKAYCGKFKRMVVEASCCDLWKA